MRSGGGSGVPTISALRRPPSRNALSLRPLLCLIGGERLARDAGAAGSIQGWMVVALEAGEDLAGDQLVAAARRVRVGPVVRQQQTDAEAAVWPAARSDGAVFQRADFAEAAVIDERDHLFDVVARHRHLRERGDGLEIVEPVLDPVFPVAVGLLARLGAMHQTDEAPFRAVRRVTMRPRLGGQHVRVQRASASKPGAVVAPIESSPTPSRPASFGPVGDATAATATSKNGFE